jgi:6-phosphogluconolactonase (cycloisomerase 2 family)
MRKILAAATIAAIGVLAACSSGGMRGASSSMLPSMAEMPLASAEFVYITNYGDNDVAAYKVASNGGLTAVKGSPFTSGTGPTALAVDPTGTYAFSADTGVTTSTGDVSVYKINASTGALTEVKGSPFSVGTEPSGVAIDPTGKYAYVSCYGSSNIYAFTIASSGALTAIKGSPFPAGTEPDYVAVDPKGKYVYVPNYGSNNVSGFSIGSGGALTALSGSPFKTGGGEAAGVTISASGKFAYVTNYGSASVTAYKIASSGALKAVKGAPFGAGTDPTNIILDPNGGKFAFVSDAAASAGTISAYSVNAKTGALKQVSGSPFQAGSTPEYVDVDPAGKFVYAPNTGSNTISAYSIGSNGALTPLSGSPFGAGTEPAAIAVCAVSSGKCVPPAL